MLKPLGKMKFLVTVMKGGTIHENTKDISIIVSSRRYAQLLVIIRPPVNPVILHKLAVKLLHIVCI